MYNEVTLNNAWIQQTICFGKAQNVFTFSVSTRYVAQILKIISVINLMSPTVMITLTRTISFTEHKKTAEQHVFYNIVIDFQIMG